MSKIIITSDLHIYAHSSNNQRLQDCLDCFEWVYSKALENSCSHLIIAGDLFHDRFFMDIAAYSKVCKIIEKYKNIETVFLLGNHDIYYEDSNIIDEDKKGVNAFASIKNWAKVIDSAQTINIDGLDIDFIPYCTNPSKYMAEFPKGRELLISHLPVAGAILNNNYNVRSIEDDSSEHETLTVNSFSKWNRTFLGHYHYGHIVGNNVEYLGSPLSLSFGESNQEKHIIIFDTKTKEYSYIVNDISPKFLILKEDEEINKNQIKNSYIRYDCYSSAVEGKLEKKKQLIENGAREVSFQNKSSIDDLKEKTEDAVSKISNSFLNTKNLIEEVIDKMELPQNINKDTLIDLINKQIL